MSISRDVEIALRELARRDPRYPVDAYRFVREALSYASDILEMGSEKVTDLDSGAAPRVEHHLTGQELCEAIRIFSLQQFGLMARAVLNNWRIESTADIGEIVYNMIGIGLMKKSQGDDRRDFQNVFEFHQAFQSDFNFCKRTLKSRG
jgi:uncharacterized repeat protein (TIGR04138 family)